MKLPSLTARIVPTGRRPKIWALAGCAASALASLGSAQNLMVGGPDTFIRRTIPVTEAFDVVGACGGIVESMVAVGETTYIGDLSGIIYVHQPGLGIGYAFNASNDAAALASDDQRLLIGGSDGTIERYDLGTQALVDVWTGPVGLRALTVHAGQVFATGDSGDVFMAPMFGSGTFVNIGSVGMAVSAMTADGPDLVLGSATGTVKRFSLSALVVEETFTVGTNIAALGMNLDQLMVAGSEGIVRRVDSEDGTVLDALNVGSSVRGLALTEGIAPAFTYCYGLRCPCGNDDPLAGCTNSRGRGARLSAAGTSSASADDLALFMTGAPANTTALVFMGNSNLLGGPALGDGILCVGGTVGLQRFGTMQTSPLGALVVDGVREHAANQFNGNFQITAGSTWNFQAWYRDVSGPCGSASNTTNTALVVFAP